MWWIFVVGAAILGILGGYAFRVVWARRVSASAEARAEQLLEAAKKKAHDVVLDAKQKSVELLEEVAKEEKDRKRDLLAAEQRLGKREDLVDQKLSRLDAKEEELEKKIEQVQKIRLESEELKEKLTKKLEEVSGLDQEKAKTLLLERVEKNFAQDLMVKLQRLEREGFDQIEKKVKDVVFTALQRYSGSHASDLTTTTIALPSDDVKGRIIGREGRNIKALERATGVELLVDETPGAITISAFDPIRREVARLALDRLVTDGRIQPARIEDEVARARQEVDRIVREAGEAAVLEVGIVGLDPRLAYLLGRLRYRTSYGQNVLLHSIEAAHIAGMLASELGANVAVAKKGALFHDIGKAVDHEVEGTHVEIGRKILKKFNVDEAVIVAMQSHHEEYPYETLEAIIVKVSESISAARPGARRETVENYLKRLEALEAIANEFPGVDKSYAIQAGREVRVFVNPEKMDDFQARELARQVAAKIEDSLQYPGEIKITVIRETRVIEYAK